MRLTIDERFNWLKQHKPIDYKGDEVFTSWETTVNEMKQDIYMYCFNHPIYCGACEHTDDEARHLLLDDLNIPRFL